MKVTVISNSGRLENSGAYRFTITGANTIPITVSSKRKVTVTVNKRDIKAAP
jgi:hypothetical protein